MHYVVGQHIFLFNLWMQNDISTLFYQLNIPYIKILHIKKNFGPREFCVNPLGPFYHPVTSKNTTIEYEPTTLANDY